MYALDEVRVDAAQFRSAVESDEPYLPLYVKLKLTWECNLRCRMCNVWRQSRSEQLTTQRVCDLAAELADLGCKKVHLTGGEVLTRPDLLQVIDAFVRRGVRVNLTTNGTLLTREMALQLADSGLRSISVSLDSPDRKTHDDLRGDGAWKRTAKGAGHLRRAIDKLKTRVHLRCNTVITRTNVYSLAGMAEFAAELGFDGLTLVPVDDPTAALRLTKRRLVEFNAAIAPQIAAQGMRYGLFRHAAEAYPFGTSKAELEYSRNGLYARGLYEHQPCYAPWTHALVTPRGRVYPCCMARSMPRPLGNLLRETFAAVWISDRYRAFRRESHRPKLPLCHACDDFLESNRALDTIVRSGGVSTEIVEEALV